MASLSKYFLSAPSHSRLQNEGAGGGGGRLQGPPESWRDRLSPRWGWGAGSRCLSPLLCLGFCGVGRTSLSPATETVRVVTTLESRRVTRRPGERSRTPNTQLGRWSRSFHCDLRPPTWNPADTPSGFPPIVASSCLHSHPHPPPPTTLESSGPGLGWGGTPLKPLLGAPWESWQEACLQGPSAVLSTCWISPALPSPGDPAPRGPCTTLASAQTRGCA